MTAQINDTCFHRGIRFSIAGISGGGLFEPQQHGIQPEAPSTACWRGYVAHYEIADGRLSVSRIELGLSPADSVRARAGKGPRLFNALPVAWQHGTFLYDGLAAPIPFTGGLLLAEGFISSLYVHMGFHPPWKYEYVREIIFESGRVTQETDRSPQMAARRAQMEDAGNAKGEPVRETPAVVKAWIDQTFSREYEMQ